jgi:hypothetical protein
MPMPFQTLAVLLIFGFSCVNAASPAVGGPPPASKTTTVAPVDTLDIKRVQAEYGDGNFETVVQILEDFRTKQKNSRPRDSVLVAKFLGVVFASNPNSREKGKYWLYRMLQMEPREDLVDLYVGEEVQNTFDKVRQEFIVRRNYKGINDTKLNQSIQANQEPGKRDTIVHRDTVVLKGDNWVSPLADVVKDGISGVKGGIKAGIDGGYVAVKEEPVSEKSWGWTGNVNFGAGIKFLSKEWATYPLTDETEFRFATDIRQRGWPINIALDFIYDQSPDVKVAVKDAATGVYNADVTSLTTYEFNAGVRKIVDFKLYSVRPFYGGGFGRMTTQQNFETAPMRRNGKISIWFNGGCYWELGRHFNIGLEYLYSWAKIDLGDGPANHGGSHFDMLAGFHF